MQKVSYVLNGKLLLVEIADNFLRRLCGLMMHNPLPAGRALLIEPCNSIHMCFMRFAIDAVYIDREYRILKVTRNLQPWLGLSFCRGAWGVLELTAGEAARYGVVPGMQLQHTQKRS